MTEAVSVPNVLLVDDDPDVLRAIVRRLRREPYAIVTASNGKEAFARLEERAFSVIVSDVRMPGIDGLTLLSEVRGKYPHVIRILISGRLNLAAAKKAINCAGVVRIFEKPLQENELMQGIRAGILANEELLRQSNVGELQAAVELEELEQKYPGISKVERSEDGAVVIPDEAKLGKN